MPEPIQTPQGPEPEPGTPAEPQNPDLNPQPSEPAVPETPPSEPSPVAPAPPVAPNYEKKFKESTTENQILNARLKEQEDARRKLTNEPTEDELRAAFPDWEFLSDSERISRNLAFKADRRAQALQAEREVEKAETGWKNTVEMAIVGTPALQGQEEAFREFANKKTHRLTPMETLVGAFLNKVSAPAQTPTPSTPEPGLESGNGGPREPSKPKSLSAKELKALRTTDYKAYQEYVKTHSINIDDIAE